ncbi:hypothetical protein [Saccharospirillum salsuginis]|uniref:Uncharacterized protein n=1 Tax=Saccharospirillum salsuginis TaxID=418750 RepID=A0A918KKE1_9GAMM|nr:hypothetical protein [Saccharospirillum salsuginis]GGX64361.1 hypothetical protein GCM10007392_35140 [Saccharospirillum salsuginis]
MTLGTWTPDQGAPTPPDADTLAKAAEFGVESADRFPSNPVDALEPLQVWMRQSRSAWAPLLEPLPTEQLVRLVRFFTLAEHHWAGWEGQDKNPVVWICKELKTRDAFPDAELTQWIKSHTENRFLPYGNPLA